MVNHRHLRRPSSQRAEPVRICHRRSPRAPHAAEREVCLLDLAEMALTVPGRGLRHEGRVMYQPEAYAIALLFMVGSMLCWGSWANTMKLTRGYAFQLFYWDYIIGIIVGALLWGFTLGSAGTSGLTFLADIRHADSVHILYALAGGGVFNVANLLLVAAIDIAGMAVAFPLGI